MCKAFLSYFSGLVCLLGLLFLPVEPLSAQTVFDEQAIFDEIFISKYLRFFDRKGKERDASSFFGEFSFPKDEMLITNNIDSLYRTRLDSLETVVKLPYNEKVKAYIDVYVNKRRKQVNIMLALSQYYFPIFEQAMEKHGVPEELKYLAIIESALNPRAVSSMGASGLWQFMYKTGRMYDLDINEKIDERLDPVKASHAAAQYLKDLYNSFGDWTLAIAAYNCGPGNVNKAIKKAHGKKDYWEIYPYLPKETRGYVPAFIGATYVMKYYNEHGFFPPDESFPFLTDTLIAPCDIYFEDVANALSVPVQVLRDLNPQYKNDVIPTSKEGYSIKLPIRLVTEFIENQDTIYTASMMKDSLQRDLLTGGRSDVHSISYRVKTNENLSFIGRKFDVSVKEIMEWNQLNSTLIHPNQILKIHTSVSNVEQVVKAVPPPVIKSDDEQDVIPIQETLTTTKPRNETSVGRNPYSTNTSSPAPTSSTHTASTASNNTPAASSTPPQKTSISAHTTSTPKTQKVVMYKVLKGDTLYNIVRKHSGSNLNDIVKFNNLRANGNLIYPDQILKIQIF